MAPGWYGEYAKPVLYFLNNGMLIGNDAFQKPCNCHHY